MISCVVFCILTDSVDSNQSLLLRPPAIAGMVNAGCIEVVLEKVPSEGS